MYFPNIYIQWNVQCIWGRRMKIQRWNTTENDMVQGTTVFLVGLAIQPWRYVQEQQRKKMQNKKYTVTTRLMSNFKTHAHTDTHIECEGGGVSHSLQARGRGEGNKNQSVAE